jgi:hypothetical protein
MDEQKYFPSWRYHATEAPRIVNDPIEDEALGEGWEHTPAAFLPAAEPAADATEPGSNEAEPKKRGRKKAA